VKSTPKSACLERRRTHRIVRRCVSLRGLGLDIRIWLAIAAAIGLASLLGLQPMPADAQQSEPSAETPKEYTLKAVFLYSVGRYVEWPKTAFADAKAPFVIGIVGDDQFEGSLDAIAKKKTIQGRKIVIRRFASVEAYKDTCHILYISRSVPSDQQTALISKTAGAPVFVISETPGFAERGGTANFLTDGDRVLLEINVDTARKAQLRMDAKLLSLAKLVGAAPTEGNN
jgi:hypothetical protein